MIWAFLIIVLFLGFSTSYTDIKYGKIKNNHLITALLAGVIYYLIIYFSGMPILLLGYAAIFFAISTVIGFFLWYFSIFGAGDAKLLAVYSFIIPPFVYHYVSVPYLPFLDIIISTFIIAVVYVAVQAIFSTSLAEKLKSLKEVFGLRNIFSYVITIFGLSWLISVLLSGLIENLFLMALAIFFLYYLFSKIFSKYTIHALIFFCVLRLVLDYKNIFNLAFVQGFIIILVFYMIIFGAVRTIAYRRNEKFISVKNIKEGMIIDGFVEDKKIKKHANIQIPLKKPLSKIEVEKIKKLWKGKKLFFSSVAVSERLPFAPFVFAGAIATIISSGSSVFFIKNLFYYLLSLL